MLVAALRDLQWRRRRVAITVFGTGLVFAMTLVLSGLSASFRVEPERFVHLLGADAFVYSRGATGPFVGGLPLAASTSADIERVPGVEHVSPMVFIQSSMKGQPYPQVGLVGVTVGGVGSPTPTSGKALSGRGQVVLSTKLGKHPGDTVTFGGRSFKVVGTIHSSLFAGMPVVFMSVGDVQDLAFGGAAVATVFAVSGHPTSLPGAFVQATPGQVVANLGKPLGAAQGAISFLAILLWVVAACVLASVMYVSTMERARDFAVFKATGVSNGALFAGLALQAVIISVVAALIGLAIGVVLAPRFPIEVSLTRSALVALPLVAVVVGLLASLAGMRRVASIDPVAAFAGP